MRPSQKIKQNVVNQIAKTTLYENVLEGEIHRVSSPAVAEME